MTPTSTFLVRALLVAALLAVSTSSFAQTTNDAIAVDIENTRAAVSSPDPETAAPLPSLPIREWQMGEALPAQQTSWQVARSLGAPPRIPRLPQPRPGKPRSAGYKGVQRILAGAAMGTMGLVVGTAAGALMGSAGCGGCEDGALYGMMIGAPVGTAAGAALGVLLTR